ncbi:MAG: nitrogen fixation protein NifU [Thermoplasmata archaeon]|jgi:nitrogen fixation NifU-like protein|nr:nitrogen fixation protein NifU [Thermoplasmata archaeon]
MSDSDMRELYQEVILDHNRRPRNFRAMDPADAKQEGFNPLCGDRLTLFLRFDGDKVADASFQGSGCAISTSSASLMTEAVKGKTKADVERVYEMFHRLIVRDGPTPTDAELGKLRVFAGVGEFPARVKCATLCWHTLHAALHGRQERVTTE